MSAGYDIEGELARLTPGVIVQRQLLDAAYAQYVANGLTPLTAAQIPAIMAAANALDEDAFAVPGDAANDPTKSGTYPATLPVASGNPGGIFVGPDATDPPSVQGGLVRIVDSNPCALDGWVQYGPDGWGEEEP